MWLGPLRLSDKLSEVVLVLSGIKGRSLMRNRSVRKNKGIILPVVLIFFSVLMLMGVTVVAMGGNQVSGSMSQVNRSQAYYLARSGAESFADHLLNKSKTGSYDEVKSILTAVEGKSSSVESIGGGEVSIKVERVEDEEKTNLNIISTAEYNGSTSEATISLLLKEKSTVETVTIPSFNNKAVVIVDNVVPTFDKKKITVSSIVAGSKSAYPAIIVPNDLHLVKKADIVMSGESVTISSDGYYDLIEMNKHSVLNFNLNNNTMIIRVKKLVLNGDVNLIKPMTKGKLIIFVDEELIIGTQNKIDVNLESDPSRLGIFYNGKNSIVNKNKLSFNGLLYAPNAQVDLGTHSDINGALVVHDLSIVNQATITSTNDSFKIPDEIVSTIEKSITLDFDENPWGKGE